MKCCFLLKIISPAKDGESEMKIKEYMDKLKVLQDEIIGCNNLIKFYSDKKELLQLEYEKLLNKEVQNDNKL